MNARCRNSSSADRVRILEQISPNPELAAASGHDLWVGLTDVDLWERARAGDASAFGELFDRHARAVYNFCFRRTGSWSVAEDLTSLVFLEAWRTREPIELLRDSALPWLYGVALNLTRNHQRTMRRRRRAIERLAPPVAIPDVADEAILRLAAEHRMCGVLRLVSALPQADQNVLAVCAWAGLSYEEAADSLGVPVGTVRSRLARARDRLRELEASSGHETHCEPIAAPTSEVTP